MSSPKCQHFSSCGGCSLQHIPYDLTLENKRKFLSDQLRRNNILFSGNIEVLHTKEYGYRNRMDFVFFQEGLGLREKDRFDKIIKINHCEIASEKINILKKEVEDFFHKAKLEPFNLKTQRGTMKYALIRACEFNDDSCISFALNADSNNTAWHIENIKDFSKITTAKSVMVSRVPAQKDDSASQDYFCIKGSEYLQEIFLGKKLLFHSQGFFQNNPATAQLMVEKAKTLLLAYETKEYTLLDSYGGVGTFGICLSDMFKKTMIVENVKESIDCAKINIKENNIANAEAFILDSAKLGKLVQKGKLMVINDPPRSGMTRQAIDSLMILEPEVIIYVSCNPSQFAKEMILFQKKYTIKSLAIFDMFPQTNHIESMAEMVRKKE
ncbi:MAG: 23S rRNA (uracil(1939)-C(5))-methyltransferase RlmD [Candidatus Nanoarchaeia archaeon]